MNYTKDTNTSKNDPPRFFCSKARLVLVTVAVIVAVVYLGSKLGIARAPSPIYSGITLTPIVQTQAKPSALPVIEPLPHHYIGDEHLQAFSVEDPEATPCEDHSRHKYNFIANDSLVVVHVQKTGCSDFLRHIVTIQKDGKYLCKLPSDILSRIDKRLSLPKGHKDRIPCFRDSLNQNGSQWLISEKTMGWKCGVHPTLSEYRSCLPTIMDNSDQHNYIYMTILRHPVLRYLSEYEHVYRGAHWSGRKKCGGNKVKDAEMPPCYPGFYNNQSWQNVTLTEFMSCKSNWANNRQVMALADLETAGCYNQRFEDRSELLLESAKCNLEKLAYFGLTEYQHESCELFKNVFNVTFSVPLEQRNMSALHSAPMLRQLWKRSDLYNKIAEINSLDMQLYKHALKLFARRVGAIGLSIDLQKVDHDVREMNIVDINLGATKFKNADFNLPDYT